VGLEQKLTGTTRGTSGMCVHVRVDGRPTAGKALRGVPGRPCETVGVQVSKGGGTGAVQADPPPDLCRLAPLLAPRAARPAAPNTVAEACRGKIGPVSLWPGGELFADPAVKVLGVR
jgi:hypothetical protein